MNDRDPELDELLRPLMNLNPTEGQMNQWLAMRYRPDRRAHSIYRALQLVAACIVGFFVGFFIKGRTVPATDFGQNFDSSATVEVVYTKNEYR